MSQQGEKDIKQLLDEFEAAKGKPFKVVGHRETRFCTGMNVTDTVAGVDRKFETVIGEKYGDFHVSLVQLKQEQPAHLKHSKSSLQIKML